MNREEITQKYKEIEEKIEELRDFYLSEPEFDDFLDDIYPAVNVGGYELYVSNIWYNCDRTLYNIALGDEEDYIKSNMKDDINDLIDEFEAEQDEDEAQEEIKELRELLRGVY